MFVVLLFLLLLCLCFSFVSGCLFVRFRMSKPTVSDLSSEMR